MRIAEISESVKRSWKGRKKKASTSKNGNEVGKKQEVRSKSQAKGFPRETVRDRAGRSGK